jgi:membrane-associated phospholipid phosphatase
VDYEVARWINESLRHHPLLALAVTDSANWGVVVFGVLAIGLWTLSAPYGDDRYKRACACGLSAAAVGLLANQLIIAVWHRPRPFEAHRQIVPLLPATHDPSFPSDHASAAFGIAFGVLFVVRRTGVVFLACAVLIGASRVLAGMHYPTDVFAGALIGLLSGYFTARLYQPLLAPFVRLAEKLTDPVLAALAGAPFVGRVVLRPRVRAAVVGALGAMLVVRIAIGLHNQLLDEMALGVLAAVVAVVLIASILAARRYWGPVESSSPPRWQT